MSVVWGDSGECEPKDEGKGPGTGARGPSLIPTPGFAWGPWSTLTLEEHLILGRLSLSQKLPGSRTRPDGQTMKQ